MCITQFSQFRLFLIIRIVSVLIFFLILVLILIFVLVSVLIVLVFVVLIVFVLIILIVFLHEIHFLSCIYYSATKNIYTLSLFNAKSLKIYKKNDIII